MKNDIYFIFFLLFFRELSWFDLYGSPTHKKLTHKDPKEKNNSKENQFSCIFSYFSSPTYCHKKENIVKIKSIPKHLKNISIFPFLNIHTYILLLFTIIMPLLTENLESNFIYLFHNELFNPV